ncbi:MAG: acetyltransferase [Rhodanobacter sp.]|jgi:UDP-perosamine 4-acetyltransferase
MRNGIVVIGGGGHAKVCVELLRAMGEIVDYCIGGEDSADACAGVPVLKGDEHIERLREIGYQEAFVAIGCNRLRERLAALAVGQGYRLVNAVSPGASISPSARLGLGVAIMAGVVINADATISDLAIINTGATIDHDCHIGRAAHIAPQCGLAGNVTVGAGSFLGIGCKVIPGLSIGEHATLGAGSVVISHIPASVIAVGVPAGIIKSKHPLGGKDEAHLRGTTETGGQ